MTNKEFKAACKTLKWRYQDAAEKLGKSVGTIKLYATKGNIPDDVAATLKVLLTDPGSVPIPDKARCTPEKDETNRMGRSWKEDALALGLENEALEKKVAYQKTQIDQQAVNLKKLMAELAKGRPPQQLEKNALRDGLTPAPENSLALERRKSAGKLGDPKKRVAPTHAEKKVAESLLFKYAKKGAKK